MIVDGLPDDRGWKPGRVATDGGVERPIVLVAMREGRDRELLVDSIGEDFRVVTTTDEDRLEAEFDCCILDRSTFQRVQPTIRRRVDGEPTFLPIVLLSGGDGDTSLESTYWNQVDDVIDLPVDRDTLLVRVENLVARRLISVELARQNERLERFASMLTHDLRNPLNVAQGAVDFVRKDYDHEDLELARQSLQRMEDLIENLRTLAREGRPVDETEPVSLEAMVEQSWSVVATGSACVTVDGDLTFQADPDRLRQILENLFRNAIEHGGDDVHIRVGTLDRGRGFYVEDDGAGIPAEARQRVFEYGHSSDPTGTGFGLAIVEEIVTAHGWEIDITEGESGGARFEVQGVETA